MKYTTALTGRRVLERAMDHLATILHGRLNRYQFPSVADFSHPHGAGVIGPGSDSLLRTVLVEALTVEPGWVEVLTTHHDLKRLFGEMTDRIPRKRFQWVLRVADSLEDTIEYIEGRASGAPGTPRVLWIVTTGADADVVHRTLESYPAAGLTGLFMGSWPYGPTHVIEEDGPRPRPRRPIRLLSPKQALDRMHAAPQKP
jgi:hypothetical protein